MEINSTNIWSRRVGAVNIVSGYKNIILKQVLCVYILVGTRKFLKDNVLCVCVFPVYLEKKIFKQQHIKKFFFCFLDFKASMLISKTHGPFYPKMWFKVMYFSPHEFMTQYVGWLGYTR